MTEYYIGQIFEETYPVDAAEWCNNNNAYIDEIKPENNIRRFEIKEQEKETAKDRKNRFLQKFFLVPNYGYYRRQPKGYQSAIESINTAYNMCKENKGLPAGVLIFYEEPDFTKPEQCTEEWLVEHQIVLPVMNEADFIQLYNLFITTWNTQEH